MAYARVQGATGEGGTSPQSAVFPATVTSGNLVVVAVIYSQVGGTTPTITVTDDKGNNYTAVDNFFVNTSGSIATFWLANITNGPKTLTATFTAGGGGTFGNFLEIDCDEFSGAGNATLDGHRATEGSFTTATDNVTTGVFTTTQNGDLIWCATQMDGTGTWTAGTGFTIGQNVTNNFATEWQTQSAASASTVGTFTIGTAGTASVGAMAFAPVAAGLLLMGQAML